MAHLQEPGNGRITICFSSHDKLPKIVRYYLLNLAHYYYIYRHLSPVVRLFGRGFVMRPGDEGWDGIVSQLDSSAVDKFHARGDEVRVVY